jgi:hypothetical protein
LRTEVSDGQLLESACLHARNARAQTAHLLADLAEIDVRRLFVQAGYSTLSVYCRDALRLSEDAAARRIHAARAARRFPAVFAMCADGRLSLTAVNLLAPHLTPSNVDELLAAAAGKSRSGIEELIRARKPLTETIGWIQPLATPPAPPVPARVDAPAHASPAAGRVRPIAAERFAVQCMLGKRAAEALCFVQDATGTDVSSILEAALVLYEALVRKRKCGMVSRPRRRPPATNSERHVPASVRREVWRRDGGRCTFTSDEGHRCGTTRGLQYDHVVPVARGGESSVDNVRLLCRAHNQYEADRVFGAAFMAGRRSGTPGATGVRT